jgi:hypothetical protein
VRPRKTENAPEEHLGSGVNWRVIDIFFTFCGSTSGAYFVSKRLLRTILDMPSQQ